MADYSADGVWHQDGSGDSADELPVSKPLVTRLRAWQEQFNAKDPFEENQGWDCRGFATEGLAIARAIKLELPDFTVVYFDLWRLAHAGDGSSRELYEYEVEATGAKWEPPPLA